MVAEAPFNARASPPHTCHRLNPSLDIWCSVNWLDMVAVEPFPERLEYVVVHRPSLNQIFPLVTRASRAQHAIGLINDLSITRKGGHEGVAGHVGLVQLKTWDASDTRRRANQLLTVRVVLPSICKAPPTNLPDCRALQRSLRHRNEKSLGGEPILAQSSHGFSLLYAWRCKSKKTPPCRWFSNRAGSFHTPHGRLP